jgi:predicted metal-dependent hydrolase
MMPDLMIGARSIPYEVRRSQKTGRKRIEVSARGVEVIVPHDTSTDDVERFVQRKRRWLHDKTEEVREEIERLRADTPRGFHSGAKILFRGRYLRLRVNTGEVDRPTLAYRTAFNIELPQGLSNGDREQVVRNLVENWLDERLAEDAWEVVRRSGVPHGLKPRGVQVKDQRTLWGSCGRDAVIRLDRKLTRVPKPVFEYVMVHELCHLEHRDHSAAFWSLVKRVLPDYQERKDWLEAHEVTLG